MTSAVYERCNEDQSFRKFVNESFYRYQRCDWGDTCKEDSELNDESVKYGERILAVYKGCGTTIWIITEWDRSSTTILFPEEY